jgi:hypothetical protein
VIVLALTPLTPLDPLDPELPPPLLPQALAITPTTIATAITLTRARPIRHRGIEVLDVILAPVDLSGQVIRRALPMEIRKHIILPGYKTRKSILLHCRIRIVPMR